MSFVSYKYSYNRLTIKDNKDKIQPMETHQVTVRHVYLTEEEAKDAVIVVGIKRHGRQDPDDIYTVVFREEGDGGLYLEACEDTNPLECIANDYPEFFTKAGEPK